MCEYIGAPIWKVHLKSVRFRITLTINIVGRICDKLLPCLNLVEKW
jgi:hypothetical protein